MSDPHLEHARIALRKWAFDRTNREISTAMKNSTAESAYEKIMGPVEELK